MVHAHVGLARTRSTTHKRPIWSIHSQKSKQLVSCGWNQIMDDYGTSIPSNIHLYVLDFPSQRERVVCANTVE